MQGVTLRLPVVLHKFMEPAILASEDYFKRWKQIGGAPREAQEIFGLAGAGKTFTAESTRQAVQGFKWAILDGVDPNPRNIVGAAVLHTSEGGNFGCLLRLEPNLQTMVS